MLESQTGDICNVTETRTLFLKKHKANLRLENTRNNKVGVIDILIHYLYNIFHLLINSTIFLLLMSQACSVQAESSFAINKILIINYLD